MNRRVDDLHVVVLHGLDVASAHQKKTTTSIN